VLQILTILKSGDSMVKKKCNTMYLSEITVFLTTETYLRELKDELQAKQNIYSVKSHKYIFNEQRLSSFTLVFLKIA